MAHITPGPVTICFRQQPCVFNLCVYNAFLDLETLPHMSQAWETPVIWFDSMCCGMCLYGPSIPQTLHVAIFPWPFPAEGAIPKV